MRTVDLTVEFRLDLEIEADGMNRTTVSIDNVVVWPRERAEVRYAPHSGAVSGPRWTEIPAVKEGDEIVLEIPSGTLRGEVEVVYERSDGTLCVRTSNSIWQGHAGGLSGGLCGCGEFRILNAEDARVTESSVLPKGTRPVRYRIYELLRELADLREPTVSPEDKGRLMMHLLEYYRKFELKGA